jgi:hypothetical protein
MRTHKAKREAYREQVEALLAEERYFVEKMLGYGTIRIDELAPLKTKERLRLLQWIGRCTGTASRSFVTADGHSIAVKLPEFNDQAVLCCNDGDLVMPNYTIAVKRGGAGHG